MEFASMSLLSTDWIQLFKGLTREIVDDRGEWAKAKKFNGSAWRKPNLVDWRSHGLSSIGKLVGYDSIS